MGRLRSALATIGAQVVVWHSHLSAGERFESWMAVARGQARVVVGARSAIFAPIANLRLIVVDEEHEPAFKQEEAPRYHGRDAAVYRAKLAEAGCVLGSATPSLESLLNSRTGRYKLNKLPNRVDGRGLPPLRLVDLRRQNNRFGPVVISQVNWADAMRDRFDKREQSILFLNRRGYSASMLCPKCGFVAHCKTAAWRSPIIGPTSKSVATGVVDCEPAPKRCPQCQAARKSAGRATAPSAWKRPPSAFSLRAKNSAPRLRHHGEKDAVSTNPHGFPQGQN